MNNDWNSNSKNSNAQPETVEDFIALLTAVKAQYGNLKVRRCNDAVDNTDDYYHFDDIVVNQKAQSVIRSGNKNESYLVFVG